MFSQLFTIRSRLFGLVILAVLGALLIAAVQLMALRSQLFTDRETLVRGAVEVAYTAIENQYKRFQAGKVSEPEAKAAAIAEIEALRYLGDEYFWINDMTPRLVAHPHLKQKIGQDVGDIVDSNGVHIFKEFARVVGAKGQGVVAYLWPKTKGAAPSPKISFVKGFKPWLNREGKLHPHQPVPEMLCI